MEQSWRKWWQMAQGSLGAAQTLERLGEARSSASRAYYAAYQAATALLLYAKQLPPEGREAWSHETTPRLLEELSPQMVAPTMQRDMETRLTELYNLRLTADYRGETEIKATELRVAIRNAAFVVKTISNIVPRE